MRFFTQHLPSDSIQRSTSGGGRHHASDQRSHHRRLLPREKRGKAYGYNSLGYTGGAMLGIVLGGVITTFVNWQFIFFINIPIGIIAVIAGWKYIKDAQRIPAKLDLAGMGLLAAALVLLSLGLVNFAAEGISVSSIVLAVVGAVLIPVFILYDKRLKNPMIDFESFKNKILRNAIFSAFFLSVGYFSVVFLVIMYLQGIRGSHLWMLRCFWCQDTLQAVFWSNHGEAL